MIGSRIWRLFPKTIRSMCFAVGFGGISTALSVAASTPAMAEVCSSSAVVAASQPTRFQFAAASQARAQWARKVARDTKLGRAYASWGRARAAKVTCRDIGGRHRCIAVGDPCRAGV